jgi:hypothetical protein
MKHDEEHRWIYIAYKHIKIDCSSNYYIPSVLPGALLYEDDVDTDVKGP